MIEIGVGTRKYLNRYGLDGAIDHYFIIFQYHILSLHDDYATDYEGAGKPLSSSFHGHRAEAHAAGGMSHN